MTNEEIEAAVCALMIRFAAAVVMAAAAGTYIGTTVAAWCAMSAMAVCSAITTAALFELEDEL